MNNKSRYLPLIIIAGLLCWLAFLLYKSQPVNADLHTEFVSSIHKLRHYDALLNQDVLEVRHQSQLNMDAISDHSKQVLALITGIRAACTKCEINPERQIVEMQALFKEKIRLIEQFKLHNGILRNSLAYIPGAVENIVEDENYQLSFRLAQLVETMLVYTLSHDPAVKEELVSRLHYLGSLGSEGRATDITHIIMHAQVVLREYEVVRTLTQRLLSSKTGQAIDLVYQTYDRNYQAAIKKTGMNRVLLFIFSILLILYVLFLFRKQHQTSHLLAKTMRYLESQKHAIDQHAIIAVTDAEGCITYANSKYQEISGYSASELLGSNQSIVSSGFHTREFYAQIWDTISTGRVWKGEIVNRAKNGKCYWVGTTIVPFLDEQEKPYQYIAIQTDITTLKNTREELQKEHELLQRILSAIPSILIGVNNTGEVNLWNPTAEAAFAISSKEIIGKKLVDIGIEWDWAELNHAIVESRNLGLSSLEAFKFKAADGKDGILGVTLCNVNIEGEHTGMLFLASDITERIQLSGQLQLSQKMEAVGELAAGIAHEINTPLQYVGDNVRFLRDAFNDMQGLCVEYRTLKKHCIEQKLAGEIIDKLNEVEEEADIEFLFEELPLAIEQSLDGINKAGGIVSAMKEFSHPGSKEKMMVDINSAIQNTMTVCRNEWKYVAEIETTFDEELPLILCLPEINQVFLNMIVNAAHAIEDKLGKGASEKGLIGIRTSHSDKYVQVEISDTGKGIPEALLSKVFEPFFTTKDVGKGTGQGLAISHNIIIDKHEGLLQVESEEGVGTTFMIKIPVNQINKEDAHG